MSKRDKDLGKRKRRAPGGPTQSASKPRGLRAAATKPGDAKDQKVLAGSDGVRVQDREHFPVVGIGASAGGLEAIEEFLTHMPPDSGIAFVVVTHQIPTRNSLLPDLLARTTQMSVLEARDSLHIEPNKVYVSPPGRNLKIENGSLGLGEYSETRGVPLPIDHFFRSLAQSRKDKAIGVVLSGTGSDGTIGITAIKGESGMAMVQDPRQAKFSGMPQSAIATGLVDYVVPVGQMPRRLIAYVKGPFLSKPRSEPEVGGTPPEMAQILNTLRYRLGHDFSGYKPNTIRRRIERRMNVHQFGEAAEYIDYLKDNPHEADLLFKELLIGVTTFFRDPEAFEALSVDGLAPMLRSTPDGATVRVWVPGCSTGEEAYSIAIVRREQLDRIGRPIMVQVFATDLDSHAIETARAGNYPEGISVDVSPERLRRFFTAENGRYAIRKEIRETVIFAQQNVIANPPFTRLDLVSCRNLLIYLDAELQKKLVELFHYALRPGGLLFLGTSESIANISELFTVLDKKWKIFQRTGPARSTALVQFPLAPKSQEGDFPPRAGGEYKHMGSGLLGLVERTLLVSYVPPTVIVDDRGDIFYIHGRTGLYLEPSPGQPNLNILEMAREGLRTELATAMRKAINQSTVVVRENVRVRSNGDFLVVRLTIRRLSEPEALRGLLMVTFSDPMSIDTVPKRKGRGDGVGRSHGLVAEVERELANTRESLQSTVEELQTTNEELKSANEELQSTNEELQSAKEELETSREELQSLNEELQTVNAELQVKVEDLSRANDDMNNLLNSTDIATLFLDNKLNIKRFTTQAKKVINLIPTDVGRPISDIVAKVDSRRLVTQAEEVLRTLIPHESEVRTTDGLWYLMHMVPYRTADSVIEGLVVTFVDIDKLKSAELAHHRVASILASSEDAIYCWDLVGTITLWNKGAERVFGYTTVEAIGQNKSILLLPERDSDTAELAGQLSHGETMEHLKTIRRRKDDRRIHVTMNIAPILDAAGRVCGFSASAREIPGS